MHDERAGDRLIADGVSAYGHAAVALDGFRLEGLELVPFRLGRLGLGPLVLSGRLARGGPQGARRKCECDGEARLATESNHGAFPGNPARIGAPMLADQSAETSARAGACSVATQSIVKIAAGGHHGRASYDGAVPLVAEFQREQRTRHGRFGRHRRRHLPVAGRARRHGVAALSVRARRRRGHAPRTAGQWSRAHPGRPRRSGRHRAPVARGRGSRARRGAGQQRGDLPRASPAHDRVRASGRRRGSARWPSTCWARRTCRTALRAPWPSAAAAGS